MTLKNKAVRTFTRIYGINIKNEDVHIERGTKIIYLFDVEDAVKELKQRNERQRLWIHAAKFTTDEQAKKKLWETLDSFDKDLDEVFG